MTIPTSMNERPECKHPRLHNALNYLLVTYAVVPMLILATASFTFKLAVVLARQAFSAVSGKPSSAPWQPTVVEGLQEITMAPLRAAYTVDRYVVHRNPDVYWFYGLPLGPGQGFREFCTLVREPPRHQVKTTPQIAKNQLVPVFLYSLAALLKLSGVTPPMAPEIPTEFANHDPRVLGRHAFTELLATPPTESPAVCDNFATALQAVPQFTEHDAFVMVAFLQKHCRVSQTHVPNHHTWMAAYAHDPDRLPHDIAAAFAKLCI